MITEKISNYVESKRDKWSPRTLSTISVVLRAVAPDFSDPSNCYTTLYQKGLSRHSIKTYFLYAGRFEQEVYGTRKFYDFLKSNNSTFRHCYKEKTRKLTREDYDRYLENADSQVRDLLVLMGQGGLRLSEALAARYEDLQDGFLWVVGKGDKQRRVPFDPSWLSSSSKKATTGLIVGHCANLRKKFQRLCTPFTPHDFRSYYATQVANNPELSMKDAQMLLGHSSIITTARYVRVDLNRVAKVLLRK